MFTNSERARTFVRSFQQSSPCSSCAYERAVRGIILIMLVFELRTVLSRVRRLGSEAGCQIVEHSGKAFQMRVLGTKYEFIYREIACRAQFRFQLRRVLELA